MATSSLRFGVSLFLLTFLGVISLSLSFTSKSSLHLTKGRNHGVQRMTLKASAVSPGEKILVIGGTGGVGQLTVGKLQSAGFEVRTTSRDKKKGQEIIADSRVEVVELDLLSDDYTALQAAMEGVTGVIISVGTTAFPTTRWKGGNTPRAIDEEAVKRIAFCATTVKTIKKVAMVTSVGVDRTDEMPFVILNLFGVLDAKKTGEQAIAAASAQGRFDYVVIRPGRLVGGPFTNLDVAKLMQVEGKQNLVRRKLNLFAYSLTERRFLARN